MEKAKLKEAQVSGKFAKSLVLDFIRDKLHGDITNLKTFDFEQLRDDAKYGYCRGRAFSAEYTPIVRAVMSLVFSEAWPEMTYDSFENYKYSIGTVNTFMMLFGHPLCDSFRGLENFRPTAEMLDRVWAFYHQCHTIGNYVVWPSRKGGFDYYRDRLRRNQRYIDSFLNAIYLAFVNGRKANIDLLQVVSNNKKTLARYRSEEGFVLMCNRLVLNHYIDNQGKPKKLFAGVWSDQKDLGRDEYFRAVEEYLAFCEKEIDYRGDHITELLKRALGMDGDMVEQDRILRIQVPKGYRTLKSLPDDPKDALSYGLETSMALCFAQVYPISYNDTMPTDNDKHIIDGIHRYLADNQGLIEVKHGVTRYDKHYVYSIVKSLREPSGVTYNLTMHIKKQGQAVCIRGSYDERGTTGIREANVFDYCKRYNLVRHDRKKGLIGWSRDPYDETYTKGVRMNRSELQEFDHSYPEHPLTMLRKFIADIIDEN